MGKEKNKHCGCCGLIENRCRCAEEMDEDDE